MSKGEETRVARVPALVALAPESIRALSQLLHKLSIKARFEKPFRNLLAKCAKGGRRRCAVLTRKQQYLKRWLW
jgi:hypothetical protein